MESRFNNEEQKDDSFNSAEAVFYRVTTARSSSQNNPEHPIFRAKNNKNQNSLEIFHTTILAETFNKY